MLWDEQRAESGKRVEEARTWDAAPAAGLSQHPSFGEFGRKLKSHQIRYFFSFLNFESLLPPAGLEIPQKQMLQHSTLSASKPGRSQT